MAYRTNVDPQLLEQLRQTIKSVAATFILRSREPSGLRSATETRKVVQDLLDRVARETRSKPNDVNVFDNIDSFSLEASPGFVKKLLEEPEIDSAFANEQSEDLLVKPVSDADAPLSASTKGSRRLSMPRGRRTR